MSKAYASGLELQQKILSGVNKLADNVAATLGPKGRNVILSRKGTNPIITKDGVTVANFVDLEDPVENAGAQLLKQAAAETNSIAGDGTTTSTVLAREILKNAQKYLIAGSSPIELKRGMDKALVEIEQNISNLSRKVETIEDIEHIATISANGDTSIGTLIATAVDKVGHEGSILVEDAKSMDTSLDLVEGFRFNSGYYAQAFVTDERKNAVQYDNALLFVTDHKVDNVKKILPVLELAAREDRPLVIVADQVEGQALAALIMNTVRGSMKVVAVKAPEYGVQRINIMKDLCLATGTNFFSRVSGRDFESVEMIDFGTCKKIEVLKNQTTVMGGAADWELIEQKIDSLKSEIKQTDDMDECRRIQYRITRLSSGVAIIKVGAATEVEMIEKKHRVEDALGAVRAAQEEGIVPGGGVTLLRCREIEIESENEDQIFGANIIRKSLEAPVRQMARNSGESEDIILNLIEGETSSHGYDFRKGEIVDMLTAGIIDPARVVRVALRNAVSVASTLITTNNAIVEVANES
jgi:chaperonin GroEL